MRKTTESAFVEFCRVKDSWAISLEIGAERDDRVGELSVEVEAIGARVQTSFVAISRKVRVESAKCIFERTFVSLEYRFSERNSDDGR